tara:strand:- start:168 stop:524 length:357 start_codon:yes stop_codon:yes gene_type:complete
MPSLTAVITTIFIIIIWLTIFLVFIRIYLKAYKIINILKVKFPKKYNELPVEPWFKKSQGNLGIWARTRYIGWKLMFNPNWFPDEIKLQTKGLRIIAFIGLAWIFLFVVGIIIIFLFL